MKQNKKTLEERMASLETKVDMLCDLVYKVYTNEQRHVWVLIGLMASALVLKALKII